MSALNPRLQPVLRMGWLEGDGDRAVAVAAGRELMALSRTAPLTNVLHPWPNQDDPDQPLRTVETFRHPVGTCRMGRSGDPDAVDRNGCVLGLDGLTVIDASIIPRIPSVNTHLCVIALAERLAALLGPHAGQPPSDRATRCGMSPAVLRGDDSDGGLEFGGDRLALGVGGRSPRDHSRAAT